MRVSEAAQASVFFLTTTGLLPMALVALCAALGWL